MNDKPLRMASDGYSRGEAWQRPGDGAPADPGRPSPRTAEPRDFRASIATAERLMGVVPLTGRTRPRPGY